MASTRVRSLPMEHLTAFSRWVYDRHFDPVQGWDTGHYYVNCTFANRTLFLSPPFEDAIVLGFGDDVRCGLHELGLPFGHDFVAREDGVVGDLWASARLRSAGSVAGSTRRALRS